jgi:hypothetical protein
MNKRVRAIFPSVLGLTGHLVHIRALRRLRDLQILGFEIPNPFAPIFFCSLKDTRDINSYDTQNVLSVNAIPNRSQSFDQIPIPTEEKMSIPLGSYTIELYQDVYIVASSRRYLST